MYALISLAGKLPKLYESIRYELACQSTRQIYFSIPLISPLNLVAPIQPVTQELFSYSPYPGDLCVVKNLALPVGRGSTTRLWCTLRYISNSKVLTRYRKALQGHPGPGLICLSQSSGRDGQKPTVGGQNKLVKRRGKLIIPPHIICVIYGIYIIE